MSRRLQVFVSSKMQELADEREAIRRALKELNIDAWVFEADAGARPRAIRETYLEELNRADLYIGLFWKDYGEYTVDEFEYARKTGKDCLIYEKREGIEGQRNPTLQEFLDRLSKVETGLTIRWFSRPDELAEFVKQDVAAWQADIVRRSHAPHLVAPFQTPPQSDKYVQRIGFHARLKADLIPREGTETLPFTRLVLHGMGGIGKTSVATALAHDREIRSLFPDGVLWASLDGIPNLLTLQSAWGRALGDPKAANLGYTDTITGTNELRTHLRDRACLLIVDGARTAEDVETAFLVGGPRCLLLVTTRQAEIAQRLDAVMIELEGLAEHEAFALFERWSGPIAEPDRTTAKWLAVQVGYLPLALELIGAQVRRIGGWSEYRRRWEEQRLEALKRGRGATGKEDNLVDSVTLSFTALPSNDREAYLRLGVFPIQATIPAGAARALWGCTEFEAVDLLNEFADSALLSRREQDGKPRFVFHALLHEFVVARLGQDGMSEAHRDVLKGYRTHCRNGWASAIDDGYLFDYLSHHLSEAGQKEDLYALIDLPWRQAQFERTHSHGSFAADVELALEIASSAKPPDWPVLVRCCQVLAMLREQTGQMPTEFFELRARLGDTESALRAAALIPEANDRSKAYLAIGDVLSKQGRTADARATLDQAAALASGVRQLAAVARRYHRAGEGDRAKQLIEEAMEHLHTSGGVHDGAWVWAEVLSAITEIGGGELARNAVDEWLLETEQAAGYDASFSAGQLAGALATTLVASSVQMERLEKVSRDLSRQGHGESALTSTIHVLSECGNVERARELTDLLVRPSSKASALVFCAAGFHKTDKAKLAQETLKEALAILTHADPVYEGYATLGRTVQDELCHLVAVLGDLGLVETFSTLAEPIADPVWHAFTCSEIALAAQEMGQVGLAEDFAARAIRALQEGSRAGPLHGGVPRCATAELLAQADQQDAALVVAEAMSGSFRAEALSRIALQLLDRGLEVPAQDVVKRLLASGRGNEPEKVDITAEVAIAESLISSGAEEAACDLLAVARAKAGTDAIALARIAEGMLHAGKLRDAQDAVRVAVNILESWEDYLWGDDSEPGRVLKMAALVYNEEEFGKAFRVASENRERSRIVFADVIQGLVQKGRVIEALRILDDVRNEQDHYVPWDEQAKAGAFAELAGVEDELTLDWLCRSLTLQNPALQARVLGRAAASWFRLHRLERASPVFAEALRLANQVGAPQARSGVLGELGRELAEAGASSLAMQAMDTLPAGPDRDNALREVGLALVRSSCFDAGVAAAEGVSDRGFREQTLVDMSEALVEQGEYPRALEVVGRVRDARYTAYITACASQHAASKGRPDEARAMLVIAEQGQKNQGIADHATLALILGKTAQTYALLGSMREAKAAAEAATDLADVISRGAWVWAWIADALERIGDHENAAAAARRALDSIQDFEDDWEKARQVGIAADAASVIGAEAAHLLLDLVRDIANEDARALALDSLYPTLKRVTAATVWESLLAAVDGLENPWNRAEVLSRLADRMVQCGDNSSLPGLLTPIYLIANDYAKAYALGRLTSALSAAGDFDTIPQVLQRLRQLGVLWAKEQGMAVAAKALFKTSQKDVAIKLLQELVEDAGLDECWDRSIRSLHACRLSRACLALGQAEEARLLADSALSASGGLDRWTFRRKSTTALMDVFGRLKSPRGLEAVLELCHDDGDSVVHANAISEMACWLARLGQQEQALDKAGLAVAGAQSSGAETHSEVFSHAAHTFQLCGRTEQAAVYLVKALCASRLVGRGALASVIATNADTLASFAQGGTLLQVVEEMRKVDSWLYV